MFPETLIRRRYRSADEALTVLQNHRSHIRPAATIALPEICIFLQKSKNRDNSDGRKNKKTGRHQLVARGG